MGQLRAHEPASTDDIGRVPAKQSGLFGKLGGIAGADNRYLLPVVVGQSAVGTRAAPILAETAAVSAVFLGEMHEDIAALDVFHVRGPSLMGKEESVRIDPVLIAAGSGSFRVELVARGVRDESTPLVGSCEVNADPGGPVGSRTQFWKTAGVQELGHDLMHSVYDQTADKWSVGDGGIMTWIQSGPARDVKMDGLVGADRNGQVVKRVAEEVGRGSPPDRMGKGLQ